MWTQLIQTAIDVVTRPDGVSTHPIRLLVMYDASGNHDGEYFMKLRRLVKGNYEKSTRIRVYIAQSKPNTPRCPSKFIRKIRRAIGSRLEYSRYFCYHPDNRFGKCTGKFDAYYLDSVSIERVNQDIGRISTTYPGTMSMLRRISDIHNVYSITNHSEPENGLTKLVTSLLVNDHIKSMPQDHFNREDTTQRSMSKDDKCSVIIFANQLH